MANQTIYLLEANGNWAKLDTESLDFAETNFAVSDVANISERKDIYTKNISLKGTKNNNKILGNIFNLNRIHDDKIDEELFFNYNINSEVDCLLFENDTLITKGLFNVPSVTVKDGEVTYSAVIKGYKISVFAKIKDKLLSDLDFTNFNHTYSVNNIVSSWTNTTGYTYPFADYGYSYVPSNDNDALNKIDYKDFRPAFFLKTYLDKIFEQDELDGYSYSIGGSTDFQDKFSKLIIPNNADALANFINGGRLLYGNKNNEQVSGGDSNQYDLDVTANKTVYKNQCSFANFVTAPSNFITPNSSIYFGYSNNVFTSSRQLSTTFETAIRVNFETTFIRNGHAGDILDFDAKICLIQRTSSTEDWSITASGDAKRIHTDGVNWNNQQLFRLKGALNVPAGGQIAVIVFCENYYKEQESGLFLTNPKLGFFRYLQQDSFIQFGDDVAISKYELALGDQIDFKNNQSFNTFKQTDFLKSLIGLFNLYVHSSLENPKHLIFETYNDYYINFTAGNLVASSTNWSKKIDYKNIELASFTTIFKNYKFSFKEDGDYLNSAYKAKWGLNYGDYTYTDNTTITADSAIEVIFSPTPIVTESTRNLPLFFTYENGFDKKPRQSNLRILFYDGLKHCSRFLIGDWLKTVDNGGTVSYSFNNLASDFTEYPMLHTIYDGLDLNFGALNEVFYTEIPDSQPIFDQYYANQITEFNDSNTILVSAKALLNEIDVANLDLRQPIYIDAPNGSAYYKVLSVDYGSNDDLSDIKLQKIYLNNNQKSQIYYNITLSKYVSNPNCATSENTFISVPAGMYSSITSQVNANALAQVHLDAMESAVINSGLCINTSNSFTFSVSPLRLDACSLATDGYQYFTTTGNLNNLSYVFRKVGSNYVRANLGYYSTGGQWYLVNNLGYITDTGSCSAPALNSFILAKNASSVSSCMGANQGINLNTYYASSYIDVGFSLYIDTIMTPAPDGYYSDAMFSYHVVSGTITQRFNC